MYSTKECSFPYSMKTCLTHNTLLQMQKRLLIMWFLFMHEVTIIISHPCQSLCLSRPLSLSLKMIRLVAGFVNFLDASMCTCALYVHYVYIYILYKQIDSFYSLKEPPFAL